MTPSQGRGENQGVLEPAMPEALVRYLLWARGNLGWLCHLKPDSSHAWVFLHFLPPTPHHSQRYLKHWLVLALSSEMLGLGLESTSFLPQFPPPTDGPRVSRTYLLSCWVLTVDSFWSSGDLGKVPGGGTGHNWLTLQAPGLVRWAETP